MSIIDSMNKFVGIGVFLAVAGAVAGFLYSIAFDKVSYSSSAQLIVLSPKTSNQAKDYASIATSRSVLEAVRGSTGIEDSIESMQQYVKTSNVSGTNIVEINVTTDDAIKSKQIAAAVAAAIGGQARQLYGEDNTSIVDAASDSVQVGDRNPIKATIFGAVAGLMLGVAVAFVFYDPNARKDNQRTERLSALPKDDNVDGSDEAGEQGLDTEFDALSLVEVAKEIPRKDDAQKEVIDIKPVGYRYSYSYNGSDGEKKKVAKKEPR